MIHNFLCFDTQFIHLVAHMHAVRIHIHTGSKPSERPTNHATIPDPRRYSWIPFFAPFLGGFVGGIAFWGTTHMFLDADLYPQWSLPVANRPLFGAWTFG